MTAVSAEESSLFSERLLNLKAELSFIRLNAGGAESALGATRVEKQPSVPTVMSPELLKWLTKNPPKHADSRVLKVAKIENGVSFYEEKELLSFNNWLKSPWPHKPDKRPHNPTAIHREIRIEANGECAICRSHQDTCEAAHLDPVAKSFNNHYAAIIIRLTIKASLDQKKRMPTFQGFKRPLHFFKRNLWLMQQELSHKLFSMQTVTS